MVVEASMMWRSAFRVNSFRQLPSVRSGLGQQFRRQTTTAARATLVDASPKQVGYWLLGCSGMAFGAVALGGITRLTESGLSMVDWKLFGRRPPSTVDEWEIEFEKYKQSPEYCYKNSDITLDDFKLIWYMEYGHRMWGRSIGAFFYLPAAYFWMTNRLTSKLKKRVIVAGALLGFQGLLGWYMVKSGLDHSNFQTQSDVPRVSQYRLAAHLSTAMVLYSLLLWSAMDVLKKPASSMPCSPIDPLTAKSLVKFRRFAMGCKGLVFITAVSGAFVAGLDAGLIYNSFPLMADRVIPDDLLSLEPVLKNFTENPTTVQFDHRILGTTTLAAITWLAMRGNKLPLNKSMRRALLTLTTLAWAQVGLGISTLLCYVPTWLAALHQSGALLTLSSSLWLSNELKVVKTLVKAAPK